MHMEPIGCTWHGYLNTRAEVYILGTSRRSNQWEITVHVAVNARHGSMEPGRDHWAIGEKPSTWICKRCDRLFRPSCRVPDYAEFCLVNELAAGGAPNLGVCSGYSSADGNARRASSGLKRGKPLPTGLASFRAPVLWSHNPPMYGGWCPTASWPSQRAITSISTPDLERCHRRGGAGMTWGETLLGFQVGQAGNARRTAC